MGDVRSRACALLVLLALASVAACTPPRAAVNEAPAPAERAPEAAAAAGTPAFPSLDLLATEGARVAPGFHEVQRKDLGGGAGLAANQPIELISAVASDACARVLVATDGPLRVQLDTSRGASLADRTVDGTEPFGPRGPLCLRRGEALLMRVDAPAGPPAPSAIDSGVSRAARPRLRVLVWSGS